MQAKNASDTAFVCSYGQGLSPALQPTRVSGHSLILPRARPPGSSHSRLCPLPILFQPGRGLREPVKDAPSFLPGLQLVLLLLPSGLHSPKLPPSWLCSAGGLPAPNRDSTKSPLPSTRQLQVQFLNSPIPGCHHPNPGYYVKDLWLWLGADAPEKKIHFKPIYITVFWCFTLLYTPKSGLWEQIPRALYGEGPNTTSKGTRSAVGMVSSFRQSEVTSG